MKKILIIEDDVILLKMYVSKFKTGDYQIITADDGEKGFDLTVANDPDFILLDLKLPKVNGWELLQHLKNTPSVKDIPVAVLTVLQDDFALKEDPNIMSNIVAYWRKDQITPSEVFEKVEEYLKTHV